MVDGHGLLGLWLICLNSHILAVATQPGVVTLHTATSLAILAGFGIVAVVAVVLVFRLIGFHVFLPFDILSTQNIFYGAGGC